MDYDRSTYGPTNRVSDWIHATKYRQPGEDFFSSVERVCRTLCDDRAHFHELMDIFLNMRFLPAGRIQRAIGTPDNVTPFNCFVSGTLEDSMDSIMDRAKQAAFTMRQGGGIGYDFSTLRPRGAEISTLRSQSSGPVSFMQIFDAVCGTISSSGHRRGAQMGVLRVDHPDILEFVRAKQNTDNLTRFNVSVGITDEFMRAVETDNGFVLRFNGVPYETVNARSLWDEIMESTYEWAEPGVLFLDRINAENNLAYCETISTSNPCAEQPLPPYGACLLGSFNLTQYVRDTEASATGGAHLFDFDKLSKDISAVVPAMDRVVDVARFPLEGQKLEAVRKRRMGLGITGFANASERLGFPYGTSASIEFLEAVLRVIRDGSYGASIRLARDRGPFPLWSNDYLKGGMASRLPTDLQKELAQYGIRNSHLTSIAPTGTISLAADNVSSGIEPVFALEYSRTIQTPDGPVDELVRDYGYDKWKIEGNTAADLSVDDHVNMVIAAQPFVDSSISKTCNVGDDVTFEQFKDVYMKAWKGGAKGCTTFRAAGKRFGILNAPTKEDDDSVALPEDEDKAQACYFDAATGIRSCEG